MLGIALHPRLGDTAFQGGLRGDAAVVALILRNSDVDVNSRDDDGRTALHVTAMPGKRHVAGVLVSRGANVSARDKDGITPAALAASNSHEAIIERMLRRSEADKYSSEDKN